jgi:uncharacterized membrane protein (GlpM family)
MNTFTPEASSNAKARAAAVFWLITFIAGAYAMYLAGSLIVNGDAAATAANILGREGAFRIATAANLLATICYLLATILVYELTKPVNRTLSLVAAVFSSLGCAVGAVISLFNFAALALLKGASVGAFTSEQLQALALTSLNLAVRGNDVGLVFFGMHIAIIGYLIATSALVPRILGALLLLGGACYELSSFGSFLGARFVTSLFPLILMPAFFAELALSLWLLVKGVSTPRASRATATASSPLVAV